MLLIFQKKIEFHLLFFNLAEHTSYSDDFLLFYSPSWAMALILDGGSHGSVFSITLQSEFPHVVSE
jgi:hypothetical protein